ncbi:MAG: biotin transporter BioY [Chloroflexota bacterium]|nr:biotin transporter BioY [Chloroflexota bacterium]
MLIARPRPLVSAVVPDRVAWRVAAVVVGSALIGLAAQVRIPLPFSPVPVTGQTFAVLLVSAALGARLGVASTVLYVAEGLAGLPVYAGGNAGLAELAGPTGGYLVGFVAAAAVVGALAQRGWDRRLATSVLAMLAGEIAIYAFGLLWLARFPLPVPLLDAGLLPFVVGDAYKLVLAALALPAAWRVVRR